MLLQLTYAFGIIILGIVLVLFYINDIIGLIVSRIKGRRRTYIVHITGFCPEKKISFCYVHTINCPHTVMRSVKDQVLNNSKCAFHDDHWYYSIDDLSVWAFLIVCNVEVGRLKKKGIKEIAINIDGTSIYRNPKAEV